MLEKVVGPGQAVVRVAVDLNWDTISRTEEKYDPDGQTARSSTINDEETDSDIAAAGGAPGMSANNVAADGTTNATSAAPAIPVNSSRTKKKVTTSTYEINKITSNILQAAGGVKRISSAVFIAQRFEGKGTDRKAVPRTPKELDDLKSIVKSSLGIQENDPTRKDELTLEETPFNDQTATEITQQFEEQNKRQVWFDLAQKLMYPALALGIIFMFWRMVKNTKVEEIPLGVPIGNGNGNGNGHYGAPGAPGSRMVTVDVLNQLIRENPANMTQAVRTWMNRAKPNN